MMTIAFVALPPHAVSQELTPADVEQHLRTSWEAWAELQLIPYEALEGMSGRVVS